MPPTSTSNDRQTYWPRTGPVGFTPDLGDDHPCRNCGYNLRGLQADARCPECGAVFGIDPFLDPLPYDQRQSFGSFISTLIIVLFSPKELAGQIWHGATIDGSAAMRFRRICITVGSISLIPTVCILIGLASNWTAAAWVSPIVAMSILVWLQSFTNDSIDFFNDKGHGSPQRRAKALGRYAAAPLLLMPAHLALLRFSFAAESFESATIAGVLACHVLILGAQLLLVASAEAALLWQLVDISRPMAFALTLGAMIPRMFFAAVYVAGIPALLGAIANSMTG